MSQLVFSLAKPLLRRWSTGFLSDRRISEKHESLVAKKLRGQSQTGIGKSLGLRDAATIRGVAPTGYGFYLPYFEEPHDSDYMYHMSEYVKTYTSGTMGKPKVYMVPRKGIRENLMRTGPSIFFVLTHDGARYRLELGDVIYANIPGGAFLANFFGDTISKTQSNIIRMVPEDSEHMTYQQKVDYFVESHREIDIAYMTVTTLLDEVRSRVKDPISLKSFVSTDVSAAPLKEQIRDFCGVYPKTIYGSTEMMLAAIPSVSHPGGFFFDWRVIYPEFVPEGQAMDTEQPRGDASAEIVPMMGVEVGKRYQLIVTPLYNDMTRYMIPDILECVGTGDDALGSEIPVFRYYSRSDRLLVLHNFTRINEAELVEVLSNAGVEFVDFTARNELDGAREYIRLYIELAEESTAEELTDRVHEELHSYDKDYRDLTDFMKYRPLNVTLLPKGSFKRYLDSKEGMARIARIGMREERLRQLVGGAA
ncbi:GH3 auxin-responsive promoter family protein [Candidatus Bathyarchaeota archaeon]|nr:GH3 auxin-responsive promoter family protein [Candidatus Bathyarchaeota archaeon]